MAEETGSEVTFRVTGGERIESVRDWSLHQGQSSPPLRSDFKYDVISVSSGEGRVDVGNEIHRNAAGDRVDIPGGQSYSVTATEKMLKFTIFSVAHWSDRSHHE